MNFYKYAKKFLSIKSPRVKYLSLLGAHLTGMRYIGVYLDPVMACNIRCQMCAFSDPGSRPRPLPKFTAERLSAVSRALFRRTLKLQLGCSAEPTLSSDLEAFVAEGRRQGIPAIELTTNGQLLDFDRLNALVDAGLTGITISLHGTTRQTYEHLMQGAKFDNLLRLVDAIKRVQTKHPGFLLRINYTFNNLNVAEMAGIPELFEGAKISVLQLRPIQNLGENTAYHDFDLSDIYNRYDELVAPVRRRAAESGVMCVAPERENLLALDAHAVDPVAAVVEHLTYCFVTSTSAYHADFDPAREDFNAYHRRHGLTRRLARAVFTGRFDLDDLKINVTKKLNYTIK